MGNLFVADAREVRDMSVEGEKRKIVSGGMGKIGSEEEREGRKEKVGRDEDRR